MFDEKEFLTAFKRIIDSDEDFRMKYLRLYGMIILPIIGIFSLLYFIFNVIKLEYPKIIETIAASLILVLMVSYLIARSIIKYKEKRKFKLQLLNLKKLFPIKSSFRNISNIINFSNSRSGFSFSEYDYYITIGVISFLQFFISVILLNIFNDNLRNYVDRLGLQIFLVIWCVVSFIILILFIVMTAITNKKKETRRFLGFNIKELIGFIMTRILVIGIFIFLGLDIFINEPFLDKILFLLHFFTIDVISIIMFLLFIFFYSKHFRKKLDVVKKINSVIKKKMLEICNFKILPKEVLSSVNMLKFYHILIFNELEEKSIIPSNWNREIYKMILLESRSCYNIILDLMYNPRYNDEIQKIMKDKIINNDSYEGIIHNSTEKLLASIISAQNKDYDVALANITNSIIIFNLLKNRDYRNWNKTLQAYENYIQAINTKDPLEQTNLIIKIAKKHKKVAQRYRIKDHWSLFYYTTYQLLFYIRKARGGNDLDSVEKAKKTLDYLTKYTSKFEDKLLEFYKKLVDAVEKYTKSGKEKAEERRYLKLAKEDANAAREYLLEVEEKMQDTIIPRDTYEAVSEHFHESTPVTPKNRRLQILIGGLIAIVATPSLVNLVTGIFGNLPIYYTIIAGLALVLLIIGGLFMLRRLNR
jgi:hypothetical protein